MFSKSIHRVVLAILTVAVSSSTPVSAQLFNQCCVPCAQPVAQTVYQTVPVTQYQKVKRTVMKPVNEVKYVDQEVTEYVPVTESKTAEVPVVNYQNVTEYRTVQRDMGGWITQQETHCENGSLSIRQPTDVRWMVESNRLRNPVCIYSQLSHGLGCISRNVVTQNRSCDPTSCGPQLAASDLQRDTLRSS